MDLFSAASAADPKNDLSAETISKMPEDDRLKAAASASQAAASANSMAESLRSKASLLTNPAERSKMLQEAYNKELEAHGNSRRARLLSSGTFQGAAGGAGIGGAVGMGLGTVVGTVVGGVATVPTVLLGGLVGAGTGVIHGPWIKLMKKDGKGKETKIPTEAIENGSVVVDQKTGKVNTMDAEGLKKARERAEKAEQQAGAGGDVQKPKKKPRKLEVRGQSKPGA